MNFFKDSKGKLTIFQSPNLPLILWFIFKMLSSVSTEGTKQELGFSRLSTSFLLVWAYLEATRGDSKFRQLLGLVAIALITASFFRA